MIHITLVFSLPSAISSLLKKNLLSRSINIVKKKIIHAFLNIPVTHETRFESIDGISIQVNILS